MDSLAFEDLDAPDTLELLGKAPEPVRAAKLTRAQVSAALKRARRHGIKDKPDAIVAALRGEQLGQPPALTAAYVVTVRALIAVIATLNEQVKALQGQVEQRFGQCPDADICLGTSAKSQPCLRSGSTSKLLGMSIERMARNGCCTHGVVGRACFTVLELMVLLDPPAPGPMVYR